ncbi:MAG: acyl-CoA dehydrogenase family protein [Cumulibacter sp.]
MIELPTNATEAQIGAIAHDWIRSNLPEQWREAAEARDWATVEKFRADDSVCKPWFAALGDSGLATPTWPREYGGLELSQDQSAPIADALEHYHAGRGMDDFVGLALAGSTILAHGTTEQKSRFLRPLARAEYRWCQLFSEPGAGSDLAGLSTSAVRQEDGSWLINGQKVWNSYAHVSEFGLLMARTDPQSPKHKGITYFLLDMSLPGVEARPLRQMTGNAEFNEVFLTDVIVPADAVLGEVNGGWSVAITTLMAERSGLTGRPAVGEGVSDELISRARNNGAWDDPLLRDAILKLVVTERALQMTTMRSFAEVRPGGVGAEGSIRKLVNASIEEGFGTLAAEIDPRHALAWGDEQERRVSQDFLAMKTTSIAGGTTQIQKNIISERVLGLPRDVDPERGVPFNQRNRA